MVSRTLEPPHRSVRPYPALPTSRPRVDLSGTWARHVNGQPYDMITVPSAYRPMGHHQLIRDVALPTRAGGQRVFLHFDAVNSFGRVSINTTPLGTMGPYAPYEFELTKVLRDGTNTVTVAIADLQPEPDGSGAPEVAIGMSLLHESYSGIFRDVYVEYRPAAFITNVRFGYTFTPGYDTANCRAELMLDAAAAGAGHVEVELRTDGPTGGTVVASAAQDVSVPAGASTIPLTFELKVPRLWSPETPNLYTLVARLRTSAGEDLYSCRTGLRDFRVSGNRLELNGKRLVVLGFIRLESWTDQGFTLSEEQMRLDMQMIKGMGANYVRLACYPNHRRIIELADELGLLITGEPPQCNTDDFSPARVKAVFEVLERTIRRDWNSPSIFGWNLGNESHFPVAYLQEGKALCNRLDPVFRTVSVAQHESFYGGQWPEFFDQGGLDYYTKHPYESGNVYEDYPKHFGSKKPLVYDEGGWEGGGESYMLDRRFDSLMASIERGETSGFAHCSWNDWRQYNRGGDPRQEDGLGPFGAVDESRKIRERIFQELGRLFQMRRHETVPPGRFAEPVPLRTPPWSARAQFRAIDLQPLTDQPSAAAAWKELEAQMAAYWPTTRLAQDQWERTGETFHFWESSEVDIAGTTFRCPVTDGRVRPLVVTPKAPELVIPIGHKCTGLHMLGHVTLPGGFPLQGKAGETAATYTVHYASGAREQIPLRYGYEITSAQLIQDATRVIPIASGAPCALVYAKDPSRERYQVLVYRLSLKKSGAVVDRVQLTLQPGAPSLLLFAVNAEAV